MKKFTKGESILEMMVASCDVGIVKLMDNAKLSLVDMLNYLNNCVYCPEYFARISQIIKDISRVITNISALNLN